MHALDVLAIGLDPWVFRAAVLAVAVWLWRRGAQPGWPIWATVTMVIGGVLGVVLKLIVARARPALPHPVAHASGYSFPSGHALNSFLCVGILILVFLPVLRPAGKAVAYTVGAALVLLTGYDRVALGVHYVSDVLAGWGAALAVIAGTAGGVRDLATGARPTVVDGQSGRRPGRGQRDEPPRLTAPAVPDHAPCRRRP